MSAESRTIPNHDASMWLRGQVETVKNDVLNGPAVLTCAHLLVPAIWLKAPVGFMCSDCFVQATGTRLGNDATCDRCGEGPITNVTSVEVDHRGGMFWLVVAFCEGCARKECLR